MRTRLRITEFRPREPRSVDHRPAGVPAAAPSTDIGAVIGFDPVSKLVFVRTHGQEVHELRAQRIEIRRDGTGVGQGLVIDASGGFLVIRLEDGEARRGDAAY